MTPDKLGKLIAQAIEECDDLMDEVYELRVYGTGEIELEMTDGETFLIQLTED